MPSKDKAEVTTAKAVPDAVALGGEEADMSHLQGGWVPPGSTSQMNDQRHVKTSSACAGTGAEDRWRHTIGVADTATVLLARQ